MPYKTVFNHLTKKRGWTTKQANEWIALKPFALIVRVHGWIVRERILAAVARGQKHVFKNGNVAIVGANGCTSSFVAPHKANAA